MKRLARLAGCLICAVVVVSIFSFDCRAEIFKYVDRDGVIHYTNAPTYGESTPVKLPPLTIENFRKYFPANVYQYRSLSLAPLANQKEYDTYIQMTCKSYGIDCNLVKAVIRAESGYNARAVSPKGAMGLMQLMPGTSRDMGVSNPFDPGQNIEGGVKYLRMMMDRFRNNLHLALAAYNAGPEAVDKYGGIPPYNETQVYVRTVMDLYKRIK